MPQESDSKAFALRKRATGIHGLDEACSGGLPAGGLVLIVGAEASGKTVLCLNVLAHAALRGESGLMVSFDESASQMRRDAASFEWADAVNQSGHVTLIDARLPDDAQASGSFGLEGLRALIAHHLEEHGTRWVVIDGVDRLARLHSDPAGITEQLVRLDEWCDANGVTVLLTGKRAGTGQTHARYLQNAEFALSTIITLSAELVERRLNRRLRIAKYRGSAHVTDEIALLIDNDGVSLPFARLQHKTAPAASQERLSTGIHRLDDVLGGGIYRYSSLLISGEPGTAKTTIAASMAEAAVTRGERVLFVSFDELADRVVRNVASVGIDLSAGISNGLLRLESRPSRPFLLEEHFIRIQEFLHQHQPSLVVLDPISALLKSDSAESTHGTIERLVAMLLTHGCTLVMTSLTDPTRSQKESTASHVSTIADTWVTLGYQAQFGERNRTLSVMKSRGTAHSNQVRELLLSNEGIDLADVYGYGSEVLTGTARMIREQEEAAQERKRQREAREQMAMLERKLTQLDEERAQLTAEYELAKDAAESEAVHSKERHQEVVNRRDPTSRGSSHTDASSRQ